MTWSAGKPSVEDRCRDEETAGLEGYGRGGVPGSVQVCTLVSRHRPDFVRKKLTVSADAPVGAVPGVAGIAARPPCGPVVDICWWDPREVARGVLRRVGGLLDPSREPAIEDFVVGRGVRPRASGDVSLDGDVRALADQHRDAGSCGADAGRVRNVRSADDWGRQNVGQSGLPRVEDGHAGALEVADVAGDDGQVVHLCGGGNQTVRDR